jgi:glycosyltransferase involved in cell wall biosynthesis
MIGLAGKIFRRLAAEARELRRWEALRRTDDIRVHYGMDRLPARNEPVSGGIVKCLDLAERFPNAAGKANLLYLVSSALPDRRELMARAAHRAGGRFVLNQNGVVYRAWAGALWRERNAPNARVYAMADFVVYQSEFCRRCAERFLGERQGPGEVLYNPVDTDVFSPRADFDRNDRAQVLLAAGSHHDAYRVRGAIEALALVRRRVTEARLVVAGPMVWGVDADAEARCWARVAGVADAVEFSGPYSQEQAPALFQKADVLVHLKAQDPCPRLVVEAMACGVPVVYSATGGTTELVGDDAGHGIPGVEDFETAHPPSVDAVADGVLRVLTDRVAFARRARERAVRLFSAHDWVDAHARIFESLAMGSEK